MVFAIIGGMERKQLIEMDFRERELDHAGTSYLPGSPEKIELMRQRVANDRQPHHPDDAGFSKLGRELDVKYFAREDCSIRVVVVSELSMR